MKIRRNNQHMAACECVMFGLFVVAFVAYLVVAVSVGWE